MPGSSPNNYAVVGVTTSGNGVYGQVATANQAGVVGRQLASSGNWAVFGFGNIRATAEPGNAARGPGKGTVAGLRERPPSSGRVADGASVSLRRLHADGATVTGVTNPASPQIVVGDVWDALDGAKFQITHQATGRRLLTGPAQQTIFLHGRELVGYRLASQSLLAQLAEWGIQPAASGNYPPPAGAGDATEPYSALPQQPQAA